MRLMPHSLEKSSELSLWLASISLARGGGGRIRMGGMGEGGIMSNK